MSNNWLYSIQYIYMYKIKNSQMFKKKIIFILQLFCAVRYYVQYVFAGAQQTFGIGGLLGNS